jgi:hypothetical protein
MPNDDVVTDQPALPFDEDGDLVEGTGEFIDGLNGDPVEVEAPDA